MRMAILRDKIAYVLEQGERETRLLPLEVLAVLYGGIIRLRNLAFDVGFLKVKKPACKVISVGNITVGGTGKTPMAVMLADMLRKRGFRPAVLSRGYGGSRKRKFTIVSDGENILRNPKEAGDEPALIARALANVPVITGKRRYFTGSYAVRCFGADVLVLDDGFQHRAVDRDVDIVLLDREKPFGNGHMLPRGGLREPRRSLKRADILVLTGTERVGDESSVPVCSHYLAQHPVFQACRCPQHLVKGIAKDVYPLEYLKGKKVCAFSGIARPEQFRKTLEPLCKEITSFIDFPDHHMYERVDVEKICRTLRATSADLIITTEKDGVKLTDYPEFLNTIYQLRIQMEIAGGPDEFEAIIMETLTK